MNRSFIHVSRLLPGDKFTFTWFQGQRYLRYHPGAPVADLEFEVRYILAQTLISCLAIGVDGRWILRHIIVGIDDLHVSVTASASDSLK